MDRAHYKPSTSKYFFLFRLYPKKKKIVARCMRFKNASPLQIAKTVQTLLKFTYFRTCRPHLTFCIQASLNSLKFFRYLYLKRMKLISVCTFIYVETYISVGVYTPDKVHEIWSICTI